MIALSESTESLTLVFREDSLVHQGVKFDKVVVYDLVLQLLLQAIPDGIFLVLILNNISRNIEGKVIKLAQVLLHRVTTFLDGLKLLIQSYDDV